MKMTLVMRRIAPFLFILVAMILLFGILLQLNTAKGKRDYYEVLDVGRDADEATLKRAYKKLAYKWHPDRNPTNQEKASQKFMEVGEAYEILSDPEKRARYDQFGDAAFEGGGGGGNFHRGGGGASRMFSWFFGDDGSKGFDFEFGGGGGNFEGYNFGGNRQRRRQPSPSEDFYDNDPYVQVLNDENFNEDTIGWIRIVEFYTPWCGHCQNLSPKWSSLGKALQGVIKIAAVNCDASKTLCTKHQINAYPTIRGFYAGSPPNGVEYNGDRSSKSLQNWAVSLIPDKVVRVNKAHVLEDLLWQCGAQGKSKVSWKVCILLFTEKATTSTLYKSLSFMYDGKIAFGLIQGKKDVSIEATFNVTSYPSIVAVCNGNKNTVEPFIKKMQPDRIRTFLNTFVAGRKCNKAVSIDSAKDVERLTASQLKEILREHGIACEGCFEKADYVRAVKEIYMT